MDITNIIVSVLALVGTLTGSWLAHRKSTALLSYQLQELKTQVEKHNKLVERMTIVERDVKTAFTRIDEVRSEMRAHHPFDRGE